MKFIIDEVIIFIPGDGLYLFASDTVEFKLSLISDRILYLLITLQGGAISKQEIHDYLWTECSVNASIASINNNLSYLRKFFKELGVSDFIITIPRVGISIKQGTSISTLPTEPVSDTTQVAFGVENAELNVSSKGRRIWVIFIGLFSSMMVLFLLIYYNKSDQTYFLGAVRQCKVFLLEEISDKEADRLITSVTNFIDGEKISCGESKVIIVNSQDKGRKYVRGNRDFFALCELNKKHIYTCDSYYYLGGRE